MAGSKHKKRKFKNVQIKLDFTIQDLYKAYYECRKRKRGSVSAMEFEFNLESNMMKLYDELKSGEYEIGTSICFVVLKPKPREVWAASFRDRIVHHLVYNAIKDRFYATFIRDTYSCIPGRGTLNAAKKVAKHAKAVTKDYTKKAYYLKADLKNFFVSIDKNVLYNELMKRIPEPWLQRLIKQIVFHNPKDNVIVQSPQWKFNLLPAYKSLWNCPPDKGLPIGNLTSQFFSNVYLDKLDQFVKHVLKCKYYCRYVDDFVIMDESPERLNYCYDRIAEFISEHLLLELHKDKKTVNLVSNGIDFVGYVAKPNRFYLRQRTLRDIFKLIRRFENGFYDLGENVLEWLFFVFNSYIGMLRAVNGYRLRQEICRRVTYPFYYSVKDFTCVRQAFVLKRLWEYAGEGTDVLPN